MTTAAETFVLSLTREYGGLAPRMLDLLLARLGAVDLAALWHDWSFWARPEQRIADYFAAGARSVGLVTGRFWGKTRSCNEFILEVAQANPGWRIGIAAQTEDDTRLTLFEGKSGLVTIAPPWFSPLYESSKMMATFPNGTLVQGYTPESPGTLRGPEHQMFWADELAHWPAGKREEAFSNAEFMTRASPAWFLWSTSPKRRHPIMRRLFQQSKADPKRHVIVTGHQRENAVNVASGLIEELAAKYGGTQRGKEEIEGLFLDDEEGALFRQDWIDKHRRDRPPSFRRRIIAVDPAISERRGTDLTGIIDLGLGVDGQVYVNGDMSGRHSPEAWGALVLDAYVRGECDCVVVERNAGGDMIAANLRAIGRERGLRVELVDAEAVTRWVQGTVYVKQVFSRAAKSDRAEPVASAYERGRVSHVRSADLAELEDEMLMWVPEAGMRSPNRIDALVFGVWELADLSGDTGGVRLDEVEGLADRVREISGRRAQEADARTIMSHPAAPAGDPRAPTSRRTFVPLNKRNIL